MSKTVLWMLCGLIVAAHSTPPPSDPSALAHAFVARVAALSHIPGIAVGVVKGGQTVFARGFGVHTHGEAVPVTTDSLFQMGSCTKTFIALGLAHFVAQDKISWDSSVHSITAGKFNTSISYLTENLSVGDLLAHRSGYGDHSGDMVWLMGDVRTERQLVEQRVRYLRPTKSLRQSFMYSNIGFEIATVVLEELAGEPWYRFIDRRFWKPLQMRHTVAGLPALSQEMAKKLSAGHIGVVPANYSVEHDEPIIDTYNLLDPLTPQLTGGIDNGYLGAGSAVTSVTDYCKWLGYLLNQTSWAESAKSTAEAESAQMIVPKEWAEHFMGIGLNYTGNALGAGFGFDVVGSLFHQQRFLTKGGDSLFHMTRTGLLPDHGVAVVVFANMEQYPLAYLHVNAIRNGLLQIFSGDPADRVWADWDVARISILKKQVFLESLNVSTFSIPLQQGRNVSVTAKVNPGGLPMLGLADLTRIFEATEIAGLSPNNTANMAGRFTSDYYGTLDVVRKADGRLSMHYGAVWCTLSALSVERSEPVRLLCPNASLHVIPGLQDPELVWDNAAHSWTFMGQATFVKQQPTGSVEDVHVKSRRSSAIERLSPLPLTSTFARALRSPYLAF